MSPDHDSTGNWSDKILSECIGEEPPPCQAACPLDIRVRDKIRCLQEGNLEAALAVVLECCPFPGILGRICSHPCEKACTRSTLDQPIAIRALKRRLADLDHEAALRVSPGPARPQKVAVVGGGPAGLMAALELRRQGYPVTLFEAERFLGGALRLYIPPYRLPREVLDRELGNVAREITRLGAGELIAACTHCLHTIGEHLPGIRTRSIYEVMLEMGLPPGANNAAGGIFNLHDACGAWQSPGIHEAVRRLVTASGHRIEEMAHNRERAICCGSGGMVPAVHPELAGKMTAFRLSKASRDLVTYCASCRARFAGAGRESLHLLELLFNPRWRTAKAAPPPGSLKRWWRRRRLQRYFMGL